MATSSLLVACSRSAQVALASMKRTSARVFRFVSLLALALALHRLLLPALLLHLADLLAPADLALSALLPLLFSPAPAFLLANFIVLAILASSPSTPPPQQPDSLGLPSFPATFPTYQPFSYSGAPLQPDLKPVRRKETSSSPPRVQQQEQQQLQKKKQDQQPQLQHKKIKREVGAPPSASACAHSPVSASTAKGIPSEHAVVTSPRPQLMKELAISERPAQEPPRTPRAVKEPGQPKRLAATTTVPVIPKPQPKQLATTDRASKEEPRVELVVKEARQPNQGVSAVAAISQKPLTPVERASQEQPKAQLGRRMVRSKSDQRISETTAASPKILRRSGTMNDASTALKTNYEDKQSTECLSDDELNKRCGDFIANHLAKMKKESLECSG